MLNITTNFANHERYCTHSTKSTVLVYNSNIKPISWSSSDLWHINDTPLPVNVDVTHLGIKRSTVTSGRISENISNKLSLARRTLYALMGSGLHGLTGINPTVSIKIYNTYVLPRLISGLESISVTKYELNELEGFHRQCLRNFQNLSSRTAIEAIYVLIGGIPLEAHLDIRRLTLFGSILHRDNSKLLKLAQRQLIMKDSDSGSWFSMISAITYKYGLTSPIDLLTEKPDKLTWKKLVKTSVFTYWDMKLKQNMREKSTLKYLTGNTISIGKPHILWTSTALNTRDIRRATIKSKLVTGTYTLQSSRSKWDKTGRITSVCPLCNSGDEDVLHFLLSCVKLQDTRYPLLHRLYQHLNDHNIATDFLDNLKLLLQLILDPTNCIILSYLKPYGLNRAFMDTLETHSRTLCFALHFRRAQALNYNP